MASESSGHAPQKKVNMADPPSNSKQEDATGKKDDDKSDSESVVSINEDTAADVERELFRQDKQVEEVYDVPSATDGVTVEERRMSVMLGMSSLKAYKAKRRHTLQAPRSFKEKVTHLFWASPKNQIAQKIFRSGLAIKSEQNRQNKSDKYIIHPFSAFRWYWDMIMVAVLLTDIIILPINISFFTESDADSASKKAMDSIMLFFDAVFLLDIILNFRTGFLDEWTEKVILQSRIVAFQYLKTWFALDIISSIPFDQVYLLFVEFFEGNAAFIAFRVLRLTKLLSLLRVLRMLRLLRYVHRLEEAVAETLNINGSVIRVFNLILLILMISHWNGCIQYLVVYIAEFPVDSWVVIDDIRNATVIEKYTTSVFRAMSHMLSIGYGSQPPVSLIDQWTVMISMMVGATFYALFIGHMSSLLVNMDAPGRVYNEKVTEVKEYMKYRRLPKKLQQRVFDYIEHKYQRKYFDEDDILHQSMSHVLRKEIMVHNCQNLVKKVSFLSNGPPEFIYDIIAHLKFEVFLPGDYVIEAGKRGSCMYFIEYGKVEVILPSGQIVNRLVDGNHFGEIALLMDERRVASVKAVEVCDCYRLTREHFDRVLQDFPYMRRHMEKIVHDRLSSIKRHSRLSSTTSPRDEQSKPSVTSQGGIIEDPRQVEVV